VSELGGVTFAHPMNPTETELREWAYSRAGEPVDDWNLALYDYDPRLLASFVVERRCPKRGYFLGLLYLAVYRHAVMENDPTGARHIVDSLRDLDSPLLDVWRTDAEAILRNDSNYGYDDWCMGGLAGQRLEEWEDEPPAS
jgi:hypothetical protein